MDFVCSNNYCCHDGAVWSGGGCAEIQVTPSSHDFGEILTGLCSARKDFIVTNRGTGILTGSVFEPAPFYCQENCDYSFIFPILIEIRLFSDRFFLCFLSAILTKRNLKIGSV